MPWESVVYFHIEDPPHKLQNTLEHLLASSVLAPQRRMQTFATFARANVRFYGQKYSVASSGIFTIFEMPLFCIKQYIKFYLVESISCLFLNHWIPSAVASYLVWKIVKQCSEGIPVVINYREPII